MKQRAHSAKRSHWPWLAAVVLPCGVGFAALDALGLGAVPIPFQPQSPMRGVPADESAGWKGTKSAFADSRLSPRRRTSCLLSCDFSRRTLPAAATRPAGNSQDACAACDASLSTAAAGPRPLLASRFSVKTAPSLPRTEHRPPSTPRSGPTPAGMAWIPGGEFWMGCDDPAMPDARPFHRVRVAGFWIDKTEVTNQRFARFVRATGYVTVAERKPDPRDFPGAPPQNLVAGSLVFTPPGGKVPLQSVYGWWRYQPGANWHHPEGPGSDLKGREKYPVVHVAWEDAAAYARWAGKRLPTEAEWELAARGGLDRQRYCWGRELKPGGRWRANIWQGHFPDQNRAEDGFRGTAPVASFPANGYGLYDMAGNVWEWCADWYRPDHYQVLAAAKQVALNPRGPANSDDPREPGIPKRVQRGGSFLCCDQYCSRYIPGARGKGAVDSGTSHVGFRCVRSAR